jgi:phosphoserine phosphatase
MEQTKDLYIVSGIGRDVTGLISLITAIISDINGNIIDLEESVLHGVFSIFITADLSNAKIRGAEFISEMQAVAHQSGLQIVAEKHRLHRRLHPRRMFRLLLLGPDHPGIVSAAAFELANHGINIERARMISRGDLFAMEMELDCSECSGSLGSIETAVSNKMKTLGIHSYFQREDMYNKSKRLLVFNLDHTLLNKGIAAEMSGLAGGAGQGDDRGAHALKGVSLKTIESIAGSARFTTDAEELLHALKTMGFMVGLVSSGYELFLAPLLSRTLLDYLAADRLLHDGPELTGEVELRVDTEEKRRSFIERLREESGCNEVIVIGTRAPADISVADCAIRIVLDGKQVPLHLLRPVLAAYG